LIGSCHHQHWLADVAILFHSFTQTGNIMEYSLNDSSTRLRSVYSPTEVYSILQPLRAAALNQASVTPTSQITMIIEHLKDS
jgi:hypothetical protein